MANFDDVPAEDVPKLYVPNSVPILYRFERSSRALLSTRLQSAAGGSHARWLLSPENHAAIRSALLPGGMLTRAVFDSWDTTTRHEGWGKRALTVAEIEAGIKTMLQDDHENSSNCAVVAVAKDIVHKLDPTATVTLEEFERLAAGEVDDIRKSVVSQWSDDKMTDILDDLPEW